MGALRLKLTLSVTAYLATIVAANWALETWGIVTVAGLTVPAGVWFAGLSFGLRDIVQEECGRLWTVGAILVGAGLSWFISPTFAVASGVAFLVSELADFAVYTPLRDRRWVTAVVASNVVGSVIDSVLFLWLAFGWAAVSSGWVDLTIGKTLMILPALALMWLVRR